MKAFVWYVAVAEPATVSESLPKTDMKDVGTSAENVRDDVRICPVRSTAICVV